MSKVKEEVKVKVKPEVKITKVIITIDTKLSDVIKYDREGIQMIFESTPGKFLELGDEIVKALSSQARMNYLVSYGLMRKERDTLTSTPQVTVRGRFAKAADRLAVDAPPEWSKKWHTCWKRPDQLHAALGMGYTYVTRDDPISGFMTDPAGHYIVGVAGAEELVLLKIPRETYEAMQKANRDESKRRNQIMDEETKENIRKLGGKPIPS
jgi:hypothetical protein